MNKISTLLISCLASFAFMSCSANQTKSYGVISSIDDLDGKPVAVLGGSVQDLLISSRCPGCMLLRVEDDADTFHMTETGKSCASIESSISWSMAKASYKNIVVVGDTIKPIPIGFAIRKDNDALRNKFDAFLADYLAENDIDSLVSEWSADDNGRSMPNPDQVKGDNGTIHFVTSAIVPPFTFVKNGEVSGIEPEIMAKFAISQGMKWDFVNVAFSGLIAYLQSGKADIGSSILCITPERQESVDFSIPYMSESSLLLVNRNYAPSEFLGEDSSETKSFVQSIKSSLEKSLIKENRYQMLLKGLKTTLLISILAALFGTLIGILLCWSSMRRNKFVSGLSNLFIEFMRCMPQVVFLMIMFYVVFGKTNIDGEWVAIIAFSLCFGAYTSVIFRSSVQSIDKGQTEAALSMGFGKVRAFINVILPQTVQRALPVYKGEFIGLVKATSIVGYIAVFDLTKAGDIIRSRTFEAFFPLILVTIMYFIVIWVLTLALKYIEKKTQPKRKLFFK